MTNLNIRDEVSFLFFAALLCSESKAGHDGAWQIAPFSCALPYRPDCRGQLVRLKDRLAERFPELIAFGDKRAAKAYQSRYDSLTKPSYIQRLLRYGPERKNQLDNLSEIAAKEPSSGGLVFSVFEPRDLENRGRPGYVPCLISGSFVLHQGEYQLNAFFRSQSIVEFGIQDLIFLRGFQEEMVGRLNQRKMRHPFEPGSLNLHFGRIMVQRRLMRNRKGFIKREEVLPEWLNIVESCMAHSPA